ncbi:hypothetical protein EV421DRAFT_1739365 [Armillaria borealis]|uniref:GPI-anchored wall transfer protein 1 n=1 Tax=Armillaria borealis TaxID=47425 RepID=A0AA39MKQ0_9AGAR|nr:hypothetical protein EV421DRAFT_1739365 [Armillaria borealis]
MGRTPVFIATLFLFFVSQTPVVGAQNMSRLLHFASSLKLSPALPAVSSPWVDLYPMPVRIRSRNLGTRSRRRISSASEQMALATKRAHLDCRRRARIPPAAFLRDFQVNGSVDASTATEESDSQSTVAVPQQEELKGESTAGIIREALICLFVLAKESVLVHMNTELDLVYAVFCLWSAAFPLVFTDIYNFNAGISGLPFLVNPVFDCDFPGLLQAAAEAFSHAIVWAYPAYRPHPHSKIIISYSTIASVSPLFGRAFFVNRGLGPGSSLAGAVKVELHTEEAVPR